MKRVSVSVSDDMNEYLVELAGEKGISKDRLIRTILERHIEHNPRGAGRKERTDIDRVGLLGDRALGMSIRKLAVKYNCSVGTVHKIINEQK